MNASSNMITSYVASRKEDACEVIGIILSELKKPERIEDASLSQLTSVLGLMIDKFGADEKDSSQEGMLPEILNEFKDVK